jgi:hypothetical protein
MISLREPSPFYLKRKILGTNKLKKKKNMTSRKKPSLPAPTQQTMLSKYFAKPPAVTPPRPVPAPVVGKRSRPENESPILLLASDDDERDAAPVARGPPSLSKRVQRMEDDPSSAKSAPPVCSSGLERLTAGKFEQNPAVHAKFLARLRPAQHEVDVSGAAAGKIQYTPFEKQYLALREQYPDVLLLIECGYKFRFIGEDAEVCMCDDDFVIVDFFCPGGRERARFVLLSRPQLYDGECSCASPSHPRETVHLVGGLHLCARIPHAR